MVHWLLTHKDECIADLAFKALPHERQEELSDCILDYLARNEEDTLSFFCASKWATSEQLHLIAKSVSNYENSANYEVMEAIIDNPNTGIATLELISNHKKRDLSQQAVEAMRSRKTKVSVKRLVKLWRKQTDADT